jgi:excinuclease UvrABC nuclease subunit
VHWYGRPHVYSWKRDTEYLYVGYSQNLYYRISSHNVINMVEPFLDADVIEVWEFPTKDEAKAHEHKLIDTHLPKYNYKALRHKLALLTNQIQ